MSAQSLHKGQPIIERKIRYDATVAYHDCTLLKMELPKIVLLHQVDKPFTILSKRKRTHDTGRNVYLCLLLDRSAL